MPDDSFDIRPEADSSVANTADFESAEISEPVSQFNYADYSSARDAYDVHHEVENNTEPEFVSYQPSQDQSYIEQPLQDSDREDGWMLNSDIAPEASYAAEPAAASLSLEDELESLLFGEEPGNTQSHADSLETADVLQAEPQDTVSDFASTDDFYTQPEQTEQNFDGLAYQETYAEPVAVSEAFATEPVTTQARMGHSGYPYYTRGNFASGIDKHEPVTPVEESAPSATFAEPSPQADADFSFDADDLMAAVENDGTDDDLSGFNDIDLSEDDFNLEASESLSDAETDHVEDINLSDFDFFSEDNLDLADGSEEEEVSPAYAHDVRSDEEYEQPSPEAPHFSAPKQVFSAPAPDVETLSVAENKVEQTHSFELPEVNYDTEENNGALDDLEAEFAEVFNLVGQDEANVATEPDAQSDADKAFEDIFRESVSTYYQEDNAAGAGAAALGLGAAAAAASTYARSTNRYTAPGQTGSQDDFYNHWAASGAQNAESGSYAAQAPRQAEDDLGEAADAYRERPVRGRRGLILASVAGAVVLLGGIGYHFIGGGSEEPVVIQADNQPVKMQPENPGGATVPNQDKAVYGRVDGTLPNAPEQKALISSGEEPVDIAAANENATSAASSDDANAPLIQPREVETMIVRSDGTIMQPQNTEPQNSGLQPSAPQATNNNASAATPTDGDEIAALAAGDGAQAPAASQPATRAPAAPAPRAPVIPSRPANQPVNVVGTVPPRTQTQAQQPAPAQAAPQVASAASAGGYFIQIASQPSAELAQKSFANMAQKYSSVIGGRSVDIKRADIAGKGTYYRVRIQGGSREEASALCSRLKSAGGDCIVTR